jgi:hypothetical protein
MAMATQALTSGVLMDVSEHWIEQIRRSDSDDMRLVVDRLCDTPATYSRWLSFHYDLMRKVAASDTSKEQLIRLRTTSFSLLHRQALFDHVRRAQVTGSDREALFAAFHGSASYAKAVLTEHGRFLESNSSLFCTDHLEFFIRNDTAFGAALADYRTQYMEFFAIYCDSVIAELRGDDFFMAPMIPELKTQLLGLQRRILAMPVGAVERQQVGGLRFFGVGSLRAGYSSIKREVPNRLRETTPWERKATAA